MADKNHEQYLEQIETAVAETTQTLMRDNQSDFLKVARMVAEKQVEVDRLKEHQKNDRKTIRELRGHLKEIFEERVAEVTELKEKIAGLENEVDELKSDASSREDSMFQTLNKKRKEESDWAIKKIDELKEENEKLKKGFANLDEVKQDEVEFITAKWDKCKEYVAKLEKELEEWKAIHPEWAPSGDLTPNFISECLDDQYENIKELKKELEQKEEEVSLINSEEMENEEKIASLLSDLDKARHEEIEKLKSEVKKLEEERPEGGWDGKFAKDACEYRRMADSYDNLSLACQLNREEKDKLKTELEAVGERNLDLQAEVEKLKKYSDELSHSNYAKQKKIDNLTNEVKSYVKENDTWNALFSEKDEKYEKQSKISTQLATKLAAADAVLDCEGWGWDEEKQDYIED